MRLKVFLMKLKENRYYLVEGECEEKLIQAFKEHDDVLLIGRIKVHNVVRKKISETLALSFSNDDCVILVYDVDGDNTSTLDLNIKSLKSKGIKKIVHVQSVRNFEDEIIKSTDESIKTINDVFSTKGKGVSTFKKKFIAHKDIRSKLIDVGFSMKKMWTSIPINSFKKYKNESCKIKK